MGAPTLFNARLRRLILAAARKGLTIAEIAEEVGISPSTLDAWLARGRSARRGSLWHAFAKDFEKARAEAEAEIAAWEDEDVDTEEVRLKWELE